MRNESESSQVGSAEKFGKPRKEFAKCPVLYLAFIIMQGKKSPPNNWKCQNHKDKKLPIIFVVFFCIVTTYYYYYYYHHYYYYFEERKRLLCREQAASYLCGMPVVYATVCSCESSQTRRYQLISSSRSSASLRARCCAAAGFSRGSLALSAPLRGARSRLPRDSTDCFLSFSASSAFLFPTVPVRAASILAARPGARGAPSRCPQII